MSDKQNETSRSSNLRAAKKAKNDEFYTQLVDIEKEVKNYKKHFKDKVVYCNCDDPEWSSFFKYFTNAFDFLGLKKVITTHYEEGKQSYKLELTKQGEVIKTNLKGDGDFRSDECIEILKEADIIITNPPFSLFREYVAQLFEYDKKFLVIGSMNAISYKETFKLIKENKLWLGITSPKEFVEPNGNIKKFGNICWYSNLEHKKRNEKIIMFKNYKEDTKYFPNYENYVAINVDKVKDIPMDYDKEMGVPITFLTSYNPNQFEIIALGIVGSIDFTSNRKQEIIKQNIPTGKFTYNGKGTLYRKYNKEKDKSPAFKDCETRELYSSIYARIIIKNKNPKKSK